MQVSVIVPCYNAAAFLPDCLAALQAQTCANLEILIIDDGSTDGTLALAQAAAARDSRIRVLHQDNAGVSAARNAGLAVAQGQYVAFVDADDDLPPQALTALLRAAGDGQPDWITADHTMVANRVPRDMICPPCPSREALLHSLVTADGLYNAVWGKLYRLAFLRQHGLTLPLGIRIGEDVLFNLQVAALARKVIHVPQTLYTYRVHTESAMGRQGDDPYTAHLPMLEAMAGYLRTAGLKAAYYRDFLALHVGLLTKGDAGMDAAARRRVNSGVSPLELSPKSALLWCAVAAHLDRAVRRRLA